VSPAGLTSEEIDAFVRDGFVRVEGAFPRRVADEGRARLWDEMGLSPHQPAGWSEAVIRLPGSGAPPFDRAANTERLHVSFDQLVGPGRWVKRSGLGTFPIRFPNRPEPDDTGWHCATGSAGDVYLCHPFLVHAAQSHRGTAPRFIAQPPLEPTRELQIDRPGWTYCPVERAIRLGLGLE
jgi:hypothetical protein